MMLPKSQLSVAAIAAVASFLGQTAWALQTASFLSPKNMAQQTGCRTVLLAVTDDVNEKIPSASSSSTSSASVENNENSQSAAAVSYLDASNRLPTSVEDQVRQAALSLERASADGKRRHNIRLLLPVIGATDLDDWPGGARQMMEAAYPLISDIMKFKDPAIELNRVILDPSDGIYAILAQATKAKDDTCAILLPTAEVISQVQDLDANQVGSSRDLILVNPQWKRQNDFGGFFSKGLENSRYMETTFEPTFSLTNLIVEGEIIRILRTYPGPWRVFTRTESETGTVDWVQVGEKDFVDVKPGSWENDSRNQRDGGMLFNYGLPSYQEVMEMLTNAPNYVPKTPVERAMAAFNFIKDTL
mmetsp:Transcript_9363/g.12419  ORF Transcript_9363/g.12419 Transcript_9363/m.12419 type:complete len:360 (+) Transcript_9363:121-1200(+)|eukprot:CAMPEP_0198145062 /NCGR_PEP_ID=MMETSP1443-20131203/20809_1 /TAXON_ID=186043 /ORGANISM="Entomoneis sp., Strain CCMP2396" /LENGTH=359 /DNA_ID=CAMNT_0043808581 /DNA_START=72 /DNA_END=1151 /DNA_ORIENTATION=+